MSCFLSQAESLPGCSNLSLVLSAGRGKVSECIIKPSQGTLERRGWGDRESSRSGKLQSHCQNRGTTESWIPANPLSPPSSNKWHRFGDDVLSSAKPIVHGKVSLLGNPHPLRCHLSYHFEAGAGLLPLPLHIDFQVSLSPKATILGKKRTKPTQLRSE